MNQHKNLYIRTQYRFKKVSVNDILYLKADRNYCHIALLNGENRLVSACLSEIASYLPESDFARIHHSYVIQLQYVNEIEGNMIIMCDGKSLTIGREYRQGTFDRFTFVGTKSRKLQKQ